MAVGYGLGNAKTSSAPCSVAPHLPCALRCRYPLRIDERLLFSYQIGKAMTLQNYLSYFDQMMKPTETLFRLVPPDKVDWSPTENGFTCGQQMYHIAEALGLYARGITRGDWGFISMRERFLANRHTPSVGVEEAVARLYENNKEFQRLVGSLTEEEFDSGEVMTPQFGGTVPRWQIALFGMEHHINHKVELFMYLKMLGVKVNTGHLYRR